LAFTLFCFYTVFVLLFYTRIVLFPITILLIFSLLIFFDSLSKSKSIQVAYLSIVAAFVQLIGYGLGFFKEKFLG
ncbi:MAG: glycosyltransferase, partial [Bacteroidota bacterium]